MRTILLLICLVVFIAFSSECRAATPAYNFYTSVASSSSSTVEIFDVLNNAQLKATTAYSHSETLYYYSTGETSEYLPAFIRNYNAISYTTLVVKGVTNNTYVYNGTEDISSGGVANGTILDGVKTASMAIYSGGYTSLQNIFYPTAAGNINQYEVVSAQQLVSAFGVASGTQIYNGTQIIGNYGTANNAVLHTTTARQTVAGGTANNTNVINGIQNITGGTAIDTAVRANGVQNISSGAAYNTHVQGGKQNISGGLVDGSLIDFFGQQNVTGGTLTNNIVQNGSAQNVDAGTVNGSLIRSGGIQNVNAGTVNDTTITSATQTVSGGVANNTAMNLGVQNVTGGTVNDSRLVNSSQIVFNGAANDTILTGSEQIVTTSGIVTGTIARNSVQRISAGGEAKDTTLYSSQQVLGDNAIISGNQAAYDSVITLDGASITGTGSIAISNSVINSTVASASVDPAFAGSGEIHFGSGQQIAFSDISGSYNIRLLDVSGVQADRIDLLTFNSGDVNFKIFGGNQVDVGATSYQLINTGAAVYIQNTYAPASYVSMLPEVLTTLDTQFYRLSNKFTDISFIYHDPEERPYTLWLNGLYDHFTADGSRYTSKMAGVDFGGAYFFYLDDAKAFASFGVKYATADTAFTTKENSDNDVISAAFSIGYAQHDSYLFSLSGSYSGASSESSLLSNGGSLPFNIDRTQYLVALEAATLFDFDAFQVQPAVIGSFHFRPASDFRLNGISGQVSDEYGATFKGNIDVRHYNDTTFDFVYDVYFRGGAGYKNGETEVKFGGYTQETDKSGLTYDLEIGCQLIGDFASLGLSAEYAVLPVGKSLAGNINFRVNF